MKNHKLLKRITLLVPVLLTAVVFPILANNIALANIAINGQNTTSHFSLVNFDVSWDNSWRTNVGPSNWDAAWVFVKFRKKTSTIWNHATLHWVDGTGTGDGHTVPAGAVIASSNDNGAGGAYGVFIYANGNLAQSSVNYTGAKLRWDYGVDGLSDADSVELAVYAIEMVYVPQTGFYVGDGNSTISGQFRIQASNSPFQITSESSLTLGGGGGSALYNNDGTGMTGGADDFNSTTSQTLPAAFPKGYKAFYMMKYEISQEQYAEFLNKLTRTQQTNRCATTTVGRFMRDNNSATTPANRNGIKLISDPGGISARVYGCDFSNNGTPGEASDGQNIACNWLSVDDFLAYCDWAGLRPMTELEYEKACRGPNIPVAGEYAWESTSILGATSISNGGTASEVSGTSGSNCVYNNSGGVQGPLRVGNFAQSGTNQVQAGAGFYGIMDLTGNLFEDMVSVGSVAGRSYTGLQGNGVLNSNGDADVDHWPGINGNNTITVANGTYGGTTGCTSYAGLGFNGSSWNDNTWLTVSGRAYRGSWASATRDSRNGGRGVRTAP